MKANISQECVDWAADAIKMLLEDWHIQHTEISRLQAENGRLNVCVKYWYESTVKLIDKAHEFEDQLRTVEQRVARECCEIAISETSVPDCYEDDLCYMAIERVVELIRAKYNLQNDQQPSQQGG